MNAIVWAALGAILVIGAILICPLLQRMDRPPRPSRPCTSDGEDADPAAVAMVERQKFYGELLRKEGKSILRPLVDGRPRGYGKAYVPSCGDKAERPTKQTTTIRRVK